MNSVKSDRGSCGGVGGLKGMTVQQIDTMTQVFRIMSAGVDVTMKLRLSISVLSGSIAGVIPTGTRTTDPPMFTGRLTSVVPMAQLGFTTVPPAGMHETSTAI